MNNNLHESIVRVSYKTGVYVADIIEQSEDRQKTLVKVRAVLKHPEQGDLHHPKQADVPFFHQRKALAEFEKTWVPSSTVKPYEGEMLPYQQSLREALDQQVQNLNERNDSWAERSLEQLSELKKDYLL
ncbi:kinase-associated lipoprotein B [Desertibacillus haloalkaliphilus]|uniref:kinase-associated lipoprotein B n=1 Tax=Desertibacillus haloalkaliphilus TaxID=1328930 RepID=UPI0028A6FF2F|nr:kinase-associated lipoprotein B [Desertibacillus haloalkaliphilus]